MEFYQKSSFFSHKHCFNLYFENRLAYPNFSWFIPVNLSFKFYCTDPRAQSGLNGKFYPILLTQAHPALTPRDWAWNGLVPPLIQQAKDWLEKGGDRMRTRAKSKTGTLYVPALKKQRFDEIKIALRSIKSVQ